MIHYIEKCFQGNQIASFYRESDDGHLTGFVAAFDNEAIVIGHITPDGLYDGYILLHMSDIIRIDSGGKYEEKIKRLYHLRKQHHEKLPISDNVYCSALQYAVENQLVTSLNMEGNVLSGLILNYSNEDIYLQIVDEFGESVGESMVQCDYVQTISIDTTEEQSIKMLMGATD